MFLSQAVDVRQRQLLSVIQICCLLKNVRVCHRQYVFVTDSVRLLQKVIICQSESNTLLIFLGLIFTYIYTYIRDFNQDLSVRY